MKKVISLVMLTAATAMLLIGCGSSSSSKDYTFKCVDQDGEAVEAVKLEACTDSLCRTGDSDQDGIVTFDGDADSYTMHVLKVPDGYEYNGEEEFVVTGAGQETEITFDKQ